MKIFEKRKFKNTFVKRIFSIKNSYNGSHKEIILFNFKISLRRNKKFYNLNYNKYLNTKIGANTVLIVELNKWHFETLPSYYRYFKQMGYDVIVITNGITDNVFSRIKEDVKLFELPFDYIENILNDVNEYECIFFNSAFLFNPEKTPKDFIKGFKKKTILLQHRFESGIDENTIVLANPMRKPELENRVVNAHYFGRIKITPKNKVVNFVSIGALIPKRRNGQLLIEATAGLLLKGVEDFKITIIGNGSFEGVPKNLRKFFDIKGRLPFDKMYKELENADFFLPLLDPENKEHDRYITTGTSGSFQLIYSFLKPPIIQKKFADIYDFNDQNSIVYERNKDLTNAMFYAININNEEYKKMQKSIKELTSTIYKKSFKNIKDLINE